MKEEEKNLIKNLSINLEIAKVEYAEAKTRFRDLDNKLNMLLVFFAGLIVAISTVISLNTNNCLLVFKKLIISLVVLLMIASVIIIMIGLFPKTYYGFNSEYLTDENWQEVDNPDLIKEYIDNYFVSIQKINQVNKIKSLCAKVAFILLALSFLILGISLTIFL